MIRLATLVAVFLALCGIALGFKRVCYHTNWSQYRPGPGKFFPEDIDPSLCSHIIYAFAKLNGNHLQPFEWNDESTPWMKGMYQRFNDLKKAQPNLKTLLALGGWNMGSAPFTRMVNTQASRNDFATYAVTFLRKHNFDGLDFDWEYPANRGSPPGDKDKFTLLIKETLAEFERESQSSGKPRLLLSAAVAAGRDKIATAYDIPQISKYLDFINLMSYDLHGSWEHFTGHHSGLYPRSGDAGDDRYLNVNSAAEYWVQKGCPKDKLIIGVPTYGRGFQLRSTSNTGVGASSRGKSRAGRFTREGGFLSYYEICQLKRSGGHTYMINEQKVPYLVKDDQWIGYEDKTSVQRKLNYIVSNGFGGVMIWSLALDDFKNQCGEGKYPLLRTLNGDTSAIPTMDYTTSPTTPSSGRFTDSTTISAIPTVSDSTRIYTDKPTQAGGSSGYQPASECQIGQDGQFASTTSCQDYYICSGGIRYEFHCQSNLVYNPTNNVCDWPTSYNCQLGSKAAAATPIISTATASPTTSTTSPITSPTTTSPTTSTASPTNSTITTTTTSPTPSCTTTPSIRSTAAKSPTTTTTSATPTVAITEKSTKTLAGIDYDNFCKPMPDGLYADPRDCHYFFNCANGITFRELCGPGTAYSGNNLPCIFEDQVKSCQQN